MSATKPPLSINLTSHVNKKRRKKNDGKHIFYSSCLGVSACQRMNIIWLISFFVYSKFRYSHRASPLIKQTITYEGEMVYIVPVFVQLKPMPDSPDTCAVFLRGSRSSSYRIQSQERHSSEKKIKMKNKKDEPKNGRRNEATAATTTRQIKIKKKTKHEPLKRVIKYLKKKKRQ